MPALGGRRRPRAGSPLAAWRNDSFRGYADYMETPAFADAIDALVCVARVDRVAIMCVKTVWWSCHPAMIADAFEARGWTVWHRLGTGAPRGHPYTWVVRIVDGVLTH